jgi:hypothetical protein
MAFRVVYEICSRDGGWSVACGGEPLFTFMRRERALRLVGLLARRHFHKTAAPSVVRLVEGEAAVDVSCMVRGIPRPGPWPACATRACCASRDRVNPTMRRLLAAAPDPAKRFLPGTRAALHA